MDGLGSPRPPAALIFVTETASATCGERRVSRFSRTQVCSRNYGRLPARLFGVDIEAARTCGRAWRKAPSFPSPAWQKNLMNRPFDVANGSTLQSKSCLAD